MTIKQQLTKGTWLRLFSMNRRDSKTQQLSCTKLYCANT